MQSSLGGEGAERAQGSVEAITEPQQRQHSLVQFASFVLINVLLMTCVTWLVIGSFHLSPGVCSEPRMSACLLVTVGLLGLS